MKNNNYVNIVSAGIAVIGGIKMYGVLKNTEMLTSSFKEKLTSKYFNPALHSEEDIPDEEILDIWFRKIR